MTAPAERLAEAWALKDACYEAWARDPAAAATAAAALAALPRDGLDAREAGVLAGLARWTAGIAAVTRGALDDALAALDEAEALLAAAGEADAAAQTQVPRIMVLSLLGRPDDALACAQAAKARLRGLGNVRAAGRVGVNLAGLLLHRDDYAGAAHHYREAAVLFARVGDTLHSVLADIGHAGALSSLGEFDEALRIHTRAGLRAQQHGLEQPLAMVDEALALLALARGQYHEALAGLERARRRFEALGLPHALAITERHLADAYLELRLLPESLDLFEATARQFAALHMPSEQAWALVQAGRAQALLGRVRGARRAFDEAAALFDEQVHAIGQASVQLAQAELAWRHGEPTAAEALAGAAAAAFESAGHADGQARAAVLRAEALWSQGRADGAREAFEGVLAQARQRGLLRVQVKALTGLGRADAAHAPQAARQWLEEALGLLEDQRRVLPGDELRAALLAEHAPSFHERLRVALEGGDAHEVLAQLERGRARGLGDHFGGEGAAATLDAARAERVNWLARRLQRLQEDGEPTAALEAELRQAERALLEDARRHRLADRSPDATPAATTGTGQPGDDDAAALVAALGATEALVAYGVVDDELFAVVARSGRLQLHRRLAGWGAVREAAQSLRLQLETVVRGADTLQAHTALLARRTQARLQALRSQVWAPLQPGLQGIERLLVVPHGPLAALPFAALVDGAAPELALAPSVRAACRGLRQAFQPPSPSQGRVLVLGESSRLPHAADEARFVGRLWPQAEVHVGAAATRAALHEGAAQAGLLHLACHAQFRSDNPRFSALHLADGLLTVAEIEGLQLPPALVVLSACDTALADQGPGDEHVGLVGAFLGAGAARVLATLWPVADDAAARLMQDFYRALRDGAAPAAALRQAQQRAAARDPSPAHWAAFVLFGGW